MAKTIEEMIAEAQRNAAESIAAHERRYGVKRKQNGGQRHQSAESRGLVAAQCPRLAI
jgi:hypothetical protein